MSDGAQNQAPQKWDAPSIDGADDQGFLTASRLQEIQKQAYDEAWQVGHADGIKEGKEQARQSVDRFDELLRALAQPFELLDEKVEKELVRLAMMVVKQLFRREIQSDPGVVVGVVREAIQAMPIASRNIVVHLHPDDARLIQELLSSPEGDRAWSMVEDPLIDRGGCTVSSDKSRVDARVHARLDAIISRIVGDERQ